MLVHGIQSCRLQLVDGQMASCSGAPSEVADVVVVNASLAYAVYYDRLLLFDGSFWTQLGQPLPPGSAAAERVPASAVWADASTVASHAGSATPESSPVGHGRRARWPVHMDMAIPRGTC